MKVNSESPRHLEPDEPEINTAQVHARVWVLIALDACDRAGLLPIGKTRLHRMVFLSNCLAELYQATPPAKRVLKYKRGPFYPDVQWQLDRLSAMGLVRVANLLIAKDHHGPWMDADYSITLAGIETTKTIRETPVGKSTGQYIDEIVFAFARISGRRLDEVALNELNYAAPGVAEGALITFENQLSNLAIQKAHEFERQAPDALAKRAREQIQLYLRYVDRKNVA